MLPVLCGLVTDYLHPATGGTFTQWSQGKRHEWWMLVPDKSSPFQKICLLLETDDGLEHLLVLLQMELEQVIAGGQSRFRAKRNRSNG